MGHADRPDMVGLIRAELPRHADPARAAQQQRYMKSELPYWGLTNPELTRALRPILDDPGNWPSSYGQWQADIRELWDGASRREERYAAIAVARHRRARVFRSDGAMDLYRHLIVTGAWWDLVDDVATHLVRDELLTAPHLVAPQVRAWAIDADLWLRRAAIICQVGAKERTDTALLAAIIGENLEGTPSAGPGGRQDFFIRKAIGWALREYGKTDPAWVRGYVDRHRIGMAGLSIHEALRRLGSG